MCRAAAAAVQVAAAAAAVWLHCVHFLVFVSIYDVVLMSCMVALQRKLQCWILPGSIASAQVQMACLRRLCSF